MKSPLIHKVLSSIIITILIMILLVSSVEAASLAQGEPPENNS